MILHKQINLLFIIVFLLHLSGCASKNASKSKDFILYQKITVSINQGGEKEAEEGLLSLMSKFPQSHFIEPSILLIMNHYLSNDEHKIASFYLQRLKEYSFNGDNNDYLLYLEMTLKYKKITSSRKTQLDLINIMNDLENFLSLYPDSKYRYNVSTMYSHLYFTNISNNEYIADLYDDLDKPDSSLYYREKNQGLDMTHIVFPK